MVTQNCFIGETKQLNLLCMSFCVFIFVMLLSIKCGNKFVTPILQSFSFELFRHTPRPDIIQHLADVLEWQPCHYALEGYGFHQNEGGKGAKGGKSTCINTTIK